MHRFLDTFQEGVHSSLFWEGAPLPFREGGLPGNPKMNNVIDDFFTRTKHAKNADFFIFSQIARSMPFYDIPRTSKVNFKLLNLFPTILDIFEMFTSLQTMTKVVERTEFDQL